MYRKRLKNFKCSDNSTSQISIKSPFSNPRYEWGSVSENAGNLSSKAATIFPNPVPSDDFTISMSPAATALSAKAASSAVVSRYSTCTLSGKESRRAAISGPASQTCSIPVASIGPARSAWTFWAMFAHFQHVAEDGDPPALRLPIRRAEQRNRRAHGGRIGVVALVDQREIAIADRQPVPLAAPLFRLQRRRAPRWPRSRSAPTSVTAPSTASAFSAMWRPGAPIAISIVSPPSVSQSVGVFVRAVELGKSEVRLGVLAEGMDVLERPAPAPSRSRKANWSLSRLRMASPPGTSPSKISALAAAISSRLLKLPRCAGAIVVMMATCGSHHLDQRPDLVGMVHADLRRRRSRVSSGMRASVSGTPQ